MNQKTLQDTIQVAEKTFGKGSLMLLGGDTARPFPAMSSGSRGLDKALGIGGYPRGRVIEIYGPESSGKTTLTLHAIAEAQASGLPAAFIDAEHAFDPRYAERLGVKLGQLLIAQPDCGEQALDVVELLTKTASVGLIVIDSVAALVPRAELEGDMGDSHLGLHARLMSQALRKLTSLAHRSGTTLVFINQLRQKIGVVFGNPETTTGGNALKFYSSVRLDVRRTGKVSLGQDVVGSRTRVRVVKNKMAPPFQECEFDLRWGQGIDAAAELLEESVREGAIVQRGAHYQFGDLRLGQGREKALRMLRERPELRAELDQMLRQNLTPAPVPAPVQPEPASDQESAAA